MRGHGLFGQVDGNDTTGAHDLDHSTAGVMAGYDWALSEMTVVGIEHVLKQLDLEAITSQGRVGAAIDKLDRLLPGLGNIARKNAGSGILVGLDAIGKRTTLDGKPATSVPLRFTDGRVMLGPIPVGRTPPLF